MYQHLDRCQIGSFRQQTTIKPQHERFPPSDKQQYVPDVGYEMLIVSNKCMLRVMQRGRTPIDEGAFVVAAGDDVEAGQSKDET